jgi:DNA repair exonuclease SbcCD nuclease subunit
MRLGGEFSCGANYRAKCATRSLKWAYEAIHRAGDIKTVCILGDLFQSMNPTPQLISVVGQIFHMYREKGIHTVLLPGNHDSVSAEWNDHALGVYRWSGVTVIENHGLVRLCNDTVEILFVTPREGVVNNYLKDILSGVWSECSTLSCDGPPSNQHVIPLCRVLALHSGISHRATPQRHIRDTNSIHIANIQNFINMYGISHVFAGHWHQHFRISPKVCQIGALVQNGWKDRDCDVGCICVLNPSTNEVTVIHVPGPRFVIVTSLIALEDLVLNARDIYPAKTDLFIEATLRASDLEPARDLLHEACGWLDGVIELRWTLLTGTETVRQSMCESAERARGDAITESCERYVQRMPLENIVSRDSVITRVIKYIRR